MSERHEWQIRIRHMLDQLAKIKAYTVSLPSHGLTTGEKFDAVLRCLQILGEAAKKVPANIQALHPGVPWRQIAGLRDIVVHDYDDVDLDLINAVVFDRLPGLADALKKIDLSNKE